MGKWAVVSNWGILRSDKGKGDVIGAIYHAGRLVDALSIAGPAGNSVLVASDTSGVWIADDGGTPAIPLSSGWDKSWGPPNLTCLARGIFGPLDVYAAGSSLWETDVTQPVPLLSWRQILVADSNKRPFATGTINRVIAIGQRQKIVMACDGGVFWADIPRPGGQYIFHQVSGLPGQRFSCVAEGPATSVLLGAWGTDQVSHFGIFVGEWTPTDLTFTPANISGVSASEMLRTEIAVFPGDRDVAYALCVGTTAMNPVVIKGVVQKDGLGNVQFDQPSWDVLLGVLKSEDGGQSWNPTGSKITGNSEVLFPWSAGQSNLAGLGQDGFNVCIGVSPIDSNVVAVGINNFFISRDGGTTWTFFGGPGSDANLHADIHSFLFDETDASRLHVCSDGGLALTTDLGASWQSPANRQFPNLKCLRFAASPHDAGVLASSMQDNGNIYASLYIDSSPWWEPDGGDGILSVIVNSGDLLRTDNEAEQTFGSTMEFIGQAIRRASWNPDSKSFDVIKSSAADSYLSAAGVVPVDGTMGGLVNGILEYVASPGVDANGESMIAVAGNGENVLGLYLKPNGAFHFKIIGTIPHLPDHDATGAERLYTVTAVGSFDGTTVFVGTNNGKIFSLDAPTWTVTNVSDPSVSTQVNRFAIPSNSDCYLIATNAVFSQTPVGWQHLTGKALPTGPGGVLPSVDTYVGIEFDRTQEPAGVYVATINGVWTSSDKGQTWFDVSNGLPNFPQISDIRIVTEPSGVPFLYVATNGWSVLRIPLGWDEFEKPVKVDGHMDLVDRVLVGKDVWAHPTFSQFRMLGPLHPVEELLLTGDDGEFRAEVKMHFEWKSDFSVVLSVDAKLIDNSDDSVDNEASGTHVIALGDSENVVIDLSSGELLPDRAHMEFVVTNG